MLDLALQSTELALFTPVVERRHEHDDDDGDEDRHSLDPTRLRLRLVAAVIYAATTSCTR